MKIRSIKPTNRFKKIPFGIIKDDLEQDPNSKHHVLTPSGWAEVKDFQYIKNGPSKVIKHDLDQLVCDPGHVIMIDRNGIRTAARADQLDPVSDKLHSFDDDLITFTISDGDKEDFYDVQIDSPHWWYTSGVVSHNSILLCNNAITSLKGMGKSGKPGQDILLVTFELDTIKTAMRCLGAATDIPLEDIPDKRDYIERVMTQMKRTYNKRFIIFEWAPDECSVNHLYALLDNLRRTEGFDPEVVILDYMDLMVSRNPSYNKDDYTRQKHVANEIRGFAKNENVLVFTATQTNRSGAAGEGVADLTKAAESFAKQFCLDYVVSLNQSDSQMKATPPRLSMFIAKNRNGPKHKTVNCTINYNTMLVREENL
jgi:hypothetical protein